MLSGERHGLPLLSESVEHLPPEPVRQLYFTELRGEPLFEAFPVECTDTTDPIEASTYEGPVSIPEGLSCDIPVTFVSTTVEQRAEVALEGEIDPLIVARGLQCREPNLEQKPEPPAPPAPAAAAANPCPEAVQELEQEAESGDAASTGGVSNSGDNSNVSTAVPQVSNTGNLQNAQGAAQSCSEMDDLEFSGSSLEISPEFESATEQAVEQAAAG